MLLISVDNQRNKLVPDDVAVTEIDHRNSVHSFERHNASTRPERLLEGRSICVYVTGHNAFELAPIESTT
jgi:hypothetical protein